MGDSIQTFVFECVGGPLDGETRCGKPGQTYGVPADECANAPECPHSPTGLHDPFRPDDIDDRITGITDWVWRHRKGKSDVLCSWCSLWGYKTWHYEDRPIEGRGPHATSCHEVIENVEWTSAYAEERPKRDA